MAFNSGMEARHKPSLRAVSEDQSSSFFSDSQTSWVMFNPSEMQPHDVLSFSTENPLTSTEDEAESLAEGSEIGATAQEQKTVFSGRQKPPSPEPEDELIDDLDFSLSNRIKEWQKTTDTSVSDNVASWGLDEDLIHQVLDTSILQKVPEYYGDQYFKNMSRLEYIRFKRSSDILRHSLSRKGYIENDPEVMSRLLSLLKWQDLLQSSGSLINDYIASTMSRAHLQGRVYQDVEFSDTATSSSLVLCGGNSSGAWNDI